MASVNIFKLDKTKEEEILVVKNKFGVKKEKILNYANDKYKFTFYFDEAGEENKLAWEWLLTSFNCSACSYSYPRSILTIEFENETFAITFGSSFFYIDKVCDKNFAFDVACRLEYSEIKTSTQIAPNSKRNKTVNTYINYNSLDFESGESYAKIKGKIKLDKDFPLFDDVIEVGSSIKLSLKQNTLENIIETLLWVNNATKQPVILNIPLFKKITDQTMLKELESQLEIEVLEDDFAIQFSELNIVGAAEIFNSNDSEFELKYKGKKKIITVLNSNEVDLFVKENGFDKNDTLNIGVVFFQNGESKFTQCVRDLIEFTYSEKKAVLSQGVWYQYNDDYLRYLTESINEIDSLYENEMDYSESERVKYIIEESAKQEYIDKYNLSGDELAHKLNNVYYAENYYNISIASKFGYKNYDRTLCTLSKNTREKIELCDLYKDGVIYTVKIGSTSAKLCYAVDQSIAALKVYKHSLVEDKPSANVFALWFILKRKPLSLVNDKPDLNELNLLILKNKLDTWKKEVRLAGFKPLIKINYVLEEGELNANQN